MAVKATSVAQVSAAVDQATEILSDRHNIREKSKIDFKITALQNQLDQINQS